MNDYEVMTPMKLILAGFALLTAVTGADGVSVIKDPVELVRSTSKEVLRIIKNDNATLKQDPAKLYDLVYQIILPIIDFDTFSKLTLGHYWRQANAEQRRRFVDEFKGMLIRTYTKYLVDYAGTEVNLLPPRGRQDPKRQTVLTEVTVPGKRPLAVNYSFWFKNDSWKVYNVTVGGISLVQLFRTDFAKEIDQTSLDKLIERLANTNNNRSVDGDSTPQN
jgi:phospholipid transport system substrate-binding protein